MTAAALIQFVHRAVKICGTEKEDNGAKRETRHTQNNWRTGVAKQAKR